jgi:hypothetical protein
LPSGYLAAYLTTTVISAVMGLGGDAVLHASAVALRDDLGLPHAIALTGASSAGKSTTAALLCAAGAQIITDDVLRLGVEADGITVRGGLREVRLRQSARSILAIKPDIDHWETEDGRLALEFDSAGTAPIPLAGVVVPMKSASDSDLTLEAMGGSEALLALAPMTRLNGWIARDILELQFDTAARLVDSMPVCIARLPTVAEFTMADAELLTRRILEAVPI